MVDWVSSTYRVLYIVTQCLLIFYDEQGSEGERQRQRYFSHMSGQSTSTNEIIGAVRIGRSHHGKNPRNYMCLISRPTVCYTTSYQLSHADPVSR